MTKMEQYEAIRRDHKLGNFSIRALSRKYKVHRRTVHLALESAQPPERKTAVQRQEIAFGPFREIVTGWLEADQSAPRKQRHTARRVWQRLVDEYDADISESTVRNAVCGIRSDINRNVAKVPVVQEHDWGQEAEVDFGEVWASISGVMVKLYMFVMRLSSSGKAFHFMYQTCDSAAFLDGHVRAFSYYGGVPKRIRYDNLKQAVITVLIGRERNENQRFVLLRSHYGFDSFYCLPGIEGAHEKGGVEGEVGRFRRRWFVPVPQVGSVAQLNDIAQVADAGEDDRHVDARTTTIGEDFAIEREHLSTVNDEVFEVGSPTAARVDAKARVAILQSKYSVPVHLVGRRVDVLVRPNAIEIAHAGTAVASHERLVGQRGESLQLDHYLETLQTKPGGLVGSTALAQARRSSAFTDTHQRFWDTARRLLGDKQGTNALIGVLLLHRTYSSSEVITGMNAALGLNNVDPQIVAIEARRNSERNLAQVVPIQQDACIERELPAIDAYDGLLEASK